MKKKLSRAQRQYDNQVPDDYHESDDVCDLREYRELEKTLPEDVEDFADLIHTYRAALEREANAKRRYEYKIDELDRLKAERTGCSYARMLQSLRRQLTAAEVRIGQLEAVAGEELPYHDGYSEAPDDRQRLNSIHLSAMAWETQTKLFLDEVKRQSKTWGNDDTE